MVPNTARGEQAIELAGEPFTLVPSLRAIEAVESQVAPLLVLYRRIVSFSTGATELATLVWLLASEGGKQKDPSRDEVLEAVLSHGVSPTVETLLPALHRIVFATEPPEELRDEEATADDAEPGKS